MASISRGEHGHEASTVEVGDVITSAFFAFGNGTIAFEENQDAIVVGVRSNTLGGIYVDPHRDKPLDDLERATALYVVEEIRTHISHGQNDPEYSYPVVFARRLDENEKYTSKGELIAFFPGRGMTCIPRVTIVSRMRRQVNFNYFGL
jgi:hypothetical protein